MATHCILNFNDDGWIYQYHEQTFSNINNMNLTLVTDTKDGHSLHSQFQRWWLDPWSLQSAAALSEHLPAWSGCTAENVNQDNYIPFTAHNGTM